jgi:ferredoxin
MAAREGNLEAPTRHPLDWVSEDFYNEESLNKEMERVFDICHGCRRCVSLCGSFPTLFDLVDESPTMEMDGVDKKDYIKVVDQCYLCDLCYMTKCPYTPPHEWNLDFPHLMLRAKAVKFKKGEVSARDKFLSNTDGLGMLAGIPVVTQTVNAVNKSPAVRSMMESALGVDKKAYKYAKLQGRAMQYINFIRDISEDNQLKRLYFPKSLIDISFLGKGSFACEFQLSCFNSMLSFPFPPP